MVAMKKSVYLQIFIAKKVLKILQFLLHGVKLFGREQELSCSGSELLFSGVIITAFFNLGRNLLH